MNNTSLYVPIMDSSVRMVKVRFMDNDDTVFDLVHNSNKQEYTYKVDDGNINVGDTVLAEARGWYQLVVVTGVTDIPMHDETKTYKWIVQKVDLHDHEHRKQHEADVIKRVNDLRAEAAREKMLAAMGINADEAQRMLQHPFDIEEAVTEAVNDDQTE